MAFGKKVASDARDTSGEWVRRFGDGDTQIRICPMQGVNVAGSVVTGTAAWPQEREHFDQDAKMAFPCTGDDECVGCNHESKKVRDTTAKVYFVALDEEGEARVWKIGRKLYKSLTAKEQRLMSKNPKTSQPLSERDYIIIRSGSGFNTEYEAEAGEAYEVDMPDPEDYPDLDEMLLEAYNEAAVLYGEEPLEPEAEEPKPRKKAAKKATRRKPEPEPEEDEDEEEEEEEPKPRKRAAKKATTRKKAAAKPEPEPEEDDEEEDEDEEAEEGLPTEATDEEISEATTEELREWLTAKGIEFPPRAARRRLVTIALEAPRY